ncbi:MAG: endo-1,4-beta-xylanase [Planctomycetota bacterium]
MEKTLTAPTPRREAQRSLIGIATAFSVLCVAAATRSHAGELVLSEFNGTDVSYSFGSLSRTVGSDSLRVFGPNDSGGIGVQIPLDLTSYADSRFVVDVTKNVGNTIDAFDLELIDTSGNAGKWRIGVADFAIETPGQVVTSTTLSNPTHGNGFSNLDLANISTWQVVGRYSTPSPFDMSLDRLIISDSVAAPPAYPGAEPDAAWRDVAAGRIAANRMADIEVRVSDAIGNALPGASVAVRMQEHEFGFGSAVRAANLIDGGTDNTIYRETFEQLFNTSVIENNLKWEPWAGEWGPNWTQARARQAVDWLRARDIDIRGHNLVWPGIENVANPAKARLQDFVDNGTPLTEAQKTQLKALIELHINDIGSEFAGDLAAWDVVNEARSNRDVLEALDEGELIMVNWFNQARSLDPNAKLYLNDFDILTGGGIDTFNQQDYLDRAQLLIDNDAPIDGIGFQSHFVEGQLTGPEQVWEILDRYEALGLDMQITEYDFETTNEQLQADFTRDFMTAVFAHEGVDDFLTWGFWEGEHWRPDAAMYRQDWSIKPNGEVFLDLVFDEWWTEEDLLAGADGLAALRGFKGDYEFIVMHDVVERVVTATLTEDGLVLDVALDLLAADFNGDRVVVTRDYTVWREGFGTEYTEADYDLWVASFGASLPASAVSVPEPAAAVLLVAGMAMASSARRRPLFDRSANGLSPEG